jgi:tetratricopeptide (TPR) repeat protein
MSPYIFGSRILLRALTGSAAVAVAISQTVMVASAKTTQEVAQIATQVTVRINPAGQSGGGSGVIISKKGNSYTVLTANHVVQNNMPYNIFTSTGKSYSVTKVVHVQRSSSEPDLAIATFKSAESYPIAAIGSSDLMGIGAAIYVCGYPAPGLGDTERSFEFTDGIVTSRPQTRPQGYTLRYNALTRGGMSGGPVLDDMGRLVGIHGQGDNAGSAQGDSGGISIKTGFNAAIPIKTFVSKIAQAGISTADLKISNTASASSKPAALSNPTKSSDFYARGLSQADKGDKTAALADLNKAIQLDVTSAKAYRSRGIARLQLIGDSDIELKSKGSQAALREAIQDFDQAIQLNPKDAVSYYNRSNRFYLGEKQEALQDSNQAIILDSGDAKSYSNRGFIRLQLDDKKEAIEDFKISLGINENNYDAYGGLGYISTEQKDYPAAIEYATQAIRVDPNRPEAYVNRGTARLYSRDTQGALEDANKAIQVKPTFAQTYNLRGSTRKQMGDKEGAISDYRKAAELFLEQGNSDMYKHSLRNIERMDGKFRFF